MRVWLWLTVALVFAMVVVGGATRLTGSGLSITEWRPLTGAIPPLSEADWAAEFSRYRASPQYELLNRGMSLAEFQFIYWWEWGHRQLGRFIGLFYLGGFLWFSLRRVVSPHSALVLFGMGLLLALQGAVGWIMVASGLEPNMTAVAPVKLALHLVFACLFLASLVAMATWLSPRERHAAAPGRLRAGASVLLFLVFMQIALGGLVAGSKAGLTYNTWPLMDGALVPRAELLFGGAPWWGNFVENAALVQFNHRLGAWLLLGVALWHAVVAVRRSGVDPGRRVVRHAHHEEREPGTHEHGAAAEHAGATGERSRPSVCMGSGLDASRRPGMTTATKTARRAVAVAILVAAQFALGVITLLLAVPIWAGLAHQALAMAILTLAVVHAVRS